MDEQVAAQLSRERAQLAAAGMADAETEARLKALRQRLELESQAELERLRREGDEALAAQRVQLLASVERATRELARATDEKPLERPAQDETAPPQQDLEIARDIASGLGSALALIERSDYSAASARLAQIRALLSREPASKAPSAAARRATDLETIKALESYVAVLRAQRTAFGRTAAPAGAEPDARSDHWPRRACRRPEDRHRGPRRHARGRGRRAPDPPPRRCAKSTRRGARPRGRRFRLPHRRRRRRRGPSRHHGSGTSPGPLKPISKG